MRNDERDSREDFEEARSLHVELEPPRTQDLIEAQRNYILNGLQDMSDACEEGHHDACSHVLHDICQCACHKQPVAKSREELEAAVAKYTASIAKCERGVAENAFNSGPSWRLALQENQRWLTEAQAALAALDAQESTGYKVGDRVEVVSPMRGYDAEGMKRTFGTVIALNTDGSVDVRWDGLTAEQIVQYPRMGVYTYHANSDRLIPAIEEASQAQEPAAEVQPQQTPDFAYACADCGYEADQEFSRCPRCKSTDIILTAISTGSALLGPSPERHEETTEQPTVTSEPRIAEGRVARVEVRMTQTQKEMLQAFCEKTGNHLSTFMVSAAITAMRDEMLRHPGLFA